MNNLNINVLFCENYNCNTNSAMHTFDEVNINYMKLNKADILLLVNSIKNTGYHIKAILSKENEKVVDLFEFDFKEKENISNDQFFINSEKFLLTLDIDKLRQNGTGDYYLSVLAHPINSDNKKEKEYNISDMELITFSKLRVKHK